METNLLSSAMIQSMARDLSVQDLVRTAEMLKQSGPAGSVETLYATWIQHNSDNPMLFAALFNYSVVLSDAGNLDAARECLTRAVSQNPDFMPAYINLGRVYERLGNLGLAIVQWSAALAKMEAVNGAAITHKTTTLNQSARTLEAVNQDDTVENLLRQSLEIDCHQREVVQHLVAIRQRQCKWPVILPSERVNERILMEGMSPLSAAAYTDDPLLHLAMAWNYNKHDVGIPALVMDSWPNASTTAAPLRIGYLSSDLREHAVGYLMTEVFGLHDRSQVETFAYYCGPKSDDPLHRHFQSAADHWVSISDMDDVTAAQRIAADGIQILVDLNGYTREARLKLVAIRPAPIIVNWLGYPGTMASPYHHYIIADDWIIPPDSERCYSEKVLRLPCYQPSARNRNVAPQRPSRRDAGLPETGMVYCCFNGMHKLTRFTFERWMMILAQVPDSVLWLLGSTETTNERLREYAGQRNIARERIVFADKLANPFHLARHELADLFLDTTPYGAHTTASDALWMGVPVLTLSGRSFASRVCGSLARAAGIPEMVCSSAEEYVDRAVTLGKNPGLLEPLRNRLRADRDSCILFDMPRLVHRLEELYQDMWSRYQQGDRPQPDLANLDVYFEVGCSATHDDMEVQTIKDYPGWWREKLARRHTYRPIEPDGRITRFQGGPPAALREKADPGNRRVVDGKK